MPSHLWSILLHWTFGLSWTHKAANSSGLSSSQACLHVQAGANLTNLGYAELLDNQEYDLNLSRNSNYIALLSPTVKADALKHLDEGSPTPERYAQVIVARGSHVPPDVMEYEVREYRCYQCLALGHLQNFWQTTAQVKLLTSEGKGKQGENVSRISLSSRMEGQALWKPGLLFHLIVGGSAAYFGQDSHKAALPGWRTFIHKAASEQLYWAPGACGKYPLLRQKGFCRWTIFTFTLLTLHQARSVSFAEYLCKLFSLHYYTLLWMQM